MAALVGFNFAGIKFDRAAEVVIAELPREHPTVQRALRDAKSFAHLSLGDQVLLLELATG